MRGLAGRARALLGRWRDWSERTTNRKIFAATTYVAAATLLVSGAHLARELVVARQFGRTEAVDAILIALVLPAFVIVVIGGALRAAFIPAYVGIRANQGQEAATAFLQTLSTAVSGALVLLTGVMAIFGSRLIPLLGSGFDPETLALTIHLFRLLVPSVVLLGLARLWAGALNAHGSFFLVALAPIFSPLLSLTFLLLLGDTLGVEAIAYGFVVGAVLEVALLVSLLRAHRLPIKLRWHRGALREVAPQMLLLTLGSAIVSATTVVDQGMAAMLSPGSVAALGYGQKVPRLLLNLGVMSLGTAALPFLSESVARADFRAIRHTLKHFVRLTLVVSVPVVIVLMLGSNLLVRLLFEEGAFSAADTRVVATVQIFLLLQVPFDLFKALFARLLVAWRRAGLIVLSAAALFWVNIAGNFIFMHVLGVAGIALSTAVVAFLSAGIMVIAALSILKQQQEAAP